MQTFVGTDHRVPGAATSPPAKQLTPEDISTALAYEHPGVVARLVRDYGHTPEQAARLFAELKKFLVLCAATPYPCSPSAIMDEAWHTFILYTEAYADFCRQHLGRFVHHRPTETPVVANRAEMLGDARQLFADHGGIADDLWPKLKPGSDGELVPDDIADCDSSCSGDSYCSEN